MYLFVDTTNEGVIDLALFDENGVAMKQLKKKIKKPLSEEFLKTLNRFQRGFNPVAGLNPLRGIIVVKGPGRFTTLRVTLATLNTIARVLNIPILGIKKLIPQKPNFQKFIRAIRAKKIRGFVLPFYGQEPSISLARKF